MKRLLCTFAMGIAAITGAIAQTKIKDGSVTGSSTLPNSAAILDLESNNKGLLLPRISLTNTTTWGLTAASANGMQVYNTNASITSTNPAYPTLPNGAGAYYWDGAGWVGMATSSGIGNIYTTDGTLAAKRTITMAGDSLKFSDAGGNAAFYNAPTGPGSGPNLILTTASPTGRANIQLSAGTSGMYMFLDGGNAAQLTSNATSLNVGLFAPSPITLYTNNVTRMTIDPAGNVDIGNGAPTSTLQVQGSMATAITSITGSYTALGTDYTIISRSASANSITLPDPSTCPGRTYMIVNNNVAPSVITVSPSIDAGGGVFITTLPINTTNPTTGYSGNKYTIQSDGNVWVLVSNS
jgi:hypothetical protein